MTVRLRHHDSAAHREEIATQVNTNTTQVSTNTTAIAALGGGGAWALIETRNISNSTTEEFTWDETAYDEIKFVIKDMQIDTDSSSVYVLAGSGNGTTFYNSSTTYRGVYEASTGSWPAMAGGTTQFALCPSNMGNAASEYLSGELVVKGFASANTGCLFESHVQYNITTGALSRVLTIGDFYGTAIAIDSVRFFVESSGSFSANGSIKMYGLTNT